MSECSTENYVSSKLLEASEERCRKIMAYSPLGILIHEAGTIAYANAAAAALFMDEHLVGNTIRAVLNPDGGEGEPEFGITDLYGTAGAGMTCVCIPRRHDEPLYVELYSTGFPLGETKAVLTYVKDITGQARAEQALRRSEQHNRLVTTHTRDLIKVLDGDGRIMFASPSHYEVLGYRPEQLVGEQFPIHVHPEDEPLFDRSSEASASGTKRPITYRCRHHDGHWSWMEALFAEVVDKDEGVVSYVVTTRDISERIYYQSQLEHLAYHDALTGLSNRRHYALLIEEASERIREARGGAAVLYMDLDRFKSINDTFGHAFGDSVLQMFGAALQACMDEGCAAARLGGDEFSILLIGEDHGERAVRIAERILAYMAEPHRISGRYVKITTSIGIALYPQHAEQIDQLVRQADRALYEAKQHGRSTYRMFEAPHSEPTGWMMSAGS